MNIRKILLDPKTVVAAVAGGFVIGLTSERLGAALMPIGTIYITFLSMCLIPILITAIVQGIARLLRDPNTRGLFKTMAVYYAVGLVLPCVVGIGTAMLLGPGLDLSPEAQRSIGELIMASPAEPAESVGVLDFLAQVIPANIFEALSTNQVMSIVFISVALGLSLGVVETPATEQALELVETIYQAFMQLFRWAIVLLAPGLLCLVAGVVAQISIDVLIALTAFVVAFYVGGVILLIIYTVVFWLAVRGPLLRTVSRLSNPNLIAFMTNNPILALPAAIETMEDDYEMDRRLPELVMPFGIFANQHGGVFLLSFLTIFLAQIYGAELGFQDLVVVAIGSIIAGATAVGGGAVLIPTVAPILGAVGLPTSLAVVVLATTDNIIGPVRTVLTLQANVTLTAMTARKGAEMSAQATQDQMPASEVS